MVMYLYVGLGRAMYSYVALCIWLCRVVKAM